MKRIVSGGVCSACRHVGSRRCIFSTYCFDISGCDRPDLRRSGVRAFARFRVCADQTGRITVIERDNKNRVLSVTRRWHRALRRQPPGRRRIAPAEPPAQQGARSVGA
jgi:hypothetical protein